MTDLTPHSYRPGPWFGILGNRATLLLPPSEKSRVADLWALVDDGAGFDEVLDLLISRGLRDLTAFVLVSTEDAVTRLVVRGAATAHVVAGQEEHTVDGSAATTWAERSFSGVEAVRLVVADVDEEAAVHTLTGGLVRVSEVTTPAAVPAPEPEAAGGDGAGVETGDLPTTGPMVVAEAPPGPIGPEPDWHHTPPPELPIGVPSGPPPPVPASAPAPVPPPDPETADHDDDTLAGSVPDEQADPEEVSRPVAVLVFSHGDEVPVDRAVLVGRAPEARRHSAGQQPRLVVVPSPAQEISSTHLEVRPGSGADHGSAVVTDLGSTNGTVLVQPGLAPEELEPGRAVQLVPGAIIDLGDEVTIQVINP